MTGRDSGTLEADQYFFPANPEGFYLGSLDALVVKDTRRFMDQWSDNTIYKQYTSLATGNADLRAHSLAVMQTHPPATNEARAQARSCTEKEEDQDLHTERVDDNDCETTRPGALWLGLIHYAC